MSPRTYCSGVTVRGFREHVANDGLADEHQRDDAGGAGSVLVGAAGRPTVFLEGFFLTLAGGVRASDELALPMGNGKTSPISAVDVALAVAAILDDPAPHIGQIYDLTGPESADLDHYARAFSDALGRPIRYRDVPLTAWSEGFRRMRFPEHVVNHLSAMTELNRQGRYDRLTDTFYKLTGKAPTNMRDFVKLHAGEFKPRLSHSAIKS